MRPGEDDRSAVGARAAPVRADHVRPHGDAAMPAWYRTAGAASWRFLAIAAAVSVVVYVLVHLRVIVIPIIVAVLASTLLLPIVSWLKRHGVPDALAAALAMLAAVLALAAVATAVALSRGLGSGAVLLGEVLTGLIVAVLLCFFLLKDGAQMWAWVLRLVRKGSRDDANEVGNRVYTALAGYVRGIAMVGLVDAVLVAIALLIIGVPLVVPLAIITFFAAFVPLIGAFVAGLLAVLVALVSGGAVDALLVLGAIILVQQVEGHLLYPLLMSRAVHLHPAVIVVALGAGGILAGIIGVFLAVPVAGVVSVILQYTQDRPPPETPLSESSPAAG